MIARSMNQRNQQFIFSAVGRAFAALSHRWRSAVAGASFATIVAFVPVAAANAPPIEYQVKAAYLSKLGNFVQWPEESDARAPDHAIICILGNDPFGDFLDKAVEGRTIGDRTIVVQRIAKFGASGVKPCKILYTSETDPKRISEVLDATQGQHVLTVGDGRGGGDSSPVITFVLKNNNVRFEIDQKAAAENGLTISSQLLALAVEVRPAR